MKTLCVCLISLLALTSSAQTSNRGTARVDEENLKVLDSVSEKKSSVVRDKASAEYPKQRTPNPENLRLGEDPFIDNMSGNARNKKK